MKQHGELIVINMIHVLIIQKNVEILRVTYIVICTAAIGSEYNILVTHYYVFNTQIETKNILKSCIYLEYLSVFISYII